MRITRLDTENADRDLTSYVTVLTHTPDAALHTWCQARVRLGDGSKDLDGTGGNFLVKITVAGQTVQPSPQTIAFSTDVRSILFTVPFMVGGGEEVIVQVKSPNAADTDVDVTADLFDIGTVDMVAVDGDAATPEVTVVTGTVTGTPAAGLFQVTVDRDIPTDVLSKAGKQIDVYSSDALPIPRGRTRIQANTRNDATTQTITVTVDLDSAPTVGDIVRIF